MSSKFPFDLDDDSSLPSVYDNITEIGGDAINSLKDAVLNIETNIGVGAQGSTSSISSRLEASLNPDGTIKPSALLGLGLVVLPITDVQVSPTAAIQESKLNLDHKTQDLFNAIASTNVNLNTALNWIALSGIKVEPHIAGSAYRHTLSHIDVSASSAGYLKDKYGLLRNNTNAYTLLSDINNDFIQHQRFDGGLTTLGTVAPVNYAHVASGIYLNPGLFSFIPQTIQDLQSFAQFIDNSNIFLYGTRIQNFYTNGVSRVSRSSSLVNDGYGAPVVPVTTVHTYFLHGASCSSTIPVDDIDVGDDIIQFLPDAAVLSNNTFDQYFANIKIGDIIRVNYGTAEVQHVVKEKRYNPNTSPRTFLVRINGKNIAENSAATARIDRPLFNREKYGVLALAAAIDGSARQLPSLIAANPRGAVALGFGFDQDVLDSTHYNLYLELYPNGNPADGAFLLPAIDITGNAGTTPGNYTLESIIEATNNAFRAYGYNYRFIAFQHDGQFGIMLADSYDNAGFAVISQITDGAGNYISSPAITNNVVDEINGIDPLGLGSMGAGYAGPPYRSAPSSPDDCALITKVLLPLKRNTYYVNGIERERLATEYLTTIDQYGDGYWFATIIASPVPNEVVYRIDLDISKSKLYKGKTLVVQPLNGISSITGYGRFIIKDVNFGTCDGYSTSITVYDGVHATTSLPVGTVVRIYFSDDSIGFNAESATDFAASILNYKRSFEIYVNQDGRTFSHERARFWSHSGDGFITINTQQFKYNALSQYLELINVSPKLRGYNHGSSPTVVIRKITLNITNVYGDNNSTFDGYICNYDGTNCTSLGPISSGKKGQIVRFYDETVTDYIDIKIDFSAPLSAGAILDIQLFPSLMLDEELMLLGTCQVDDVAKTISNLVDRREFGNVSEEQFSYSALNFMSAGEKYLHQNGVVRGFDIVNITDDTISLRGGLALVNGKFVNLNNQKIKIPSVLEYYSSTNFAIINWALCINDKNELVALPLTDVIDTGALIRPADRIVNLKNPITSSTYDVDGYTFSGIVNNRKDLTMLYIVNAELSGGPPFALTLNASDARKFANDSSGNIPITMTSDTAQGNFKTFEAVNTWLSFNAAFNAVVVLKGEYTIDQTYTLDYASEVRFVGDGAIFNVTVAKGFNVVNNVHFENIKFNYLYNPDGQPNYDYTNLVNSYTGLIYCNVTTNKNIAVKNCKFYGGYKPSVGGPVITYVHRTPFISFEYKASPLTSESYLQDVEITGNIFDVIPDNRMNDIRAVVSIISDVEATSGDINYAKMKLINCKISDNKCSQEQLIILSAAFQLATSKIPDAISTINTYIDNNICGSIGVISRIDSQINTFNDGEFTLNKDQHLYVRNNTCKYIGLLQSNGQYVGMEFNILEAPTGNISIQNNTCSWIHYGSNPLTTNSYKNTILIEGNRLSAYDVNFLSRHLLVSAVPNPANPYTLANLNIAIYCSNATLNDSYSNKKHLNVKIVNNTVTSGYEYDVPTSTTLTYQYRYCVNIQDNSIIQDNIFDGIEDQAGIPPYILYFSAFIVTANLSSHIIKNNKFIRGTNAVFNYILMDPLLPSSYDGYVSHIITENSFDAYTTGTLVASIPTALCSYSDGFRTVASKSIYEKNKNQVSRFMLDLDDMSISVQDNVTIGHSGPNPAIYAANNGSFVDQFSVENRLISDPDTNGNGRIIKYKINLTPKLPVGAKIIAIQLSARLSGYLDPASTVGNSIYLLAQYFDTLGLNAYKTTPTASFISAYSYDCYANELALRTSDQIITLNTTSTTGPGSPGTFTINPDLGYIEFYMTLSYTNNASLAQPLYWRFSPIVLTYIC